MCLGEKNERGDRKTMDGIPSFYLENVGGPFIFHCDYDLCLLNLSNMPAFLSILIFSKRGLKFRGYTRLTCTKITLEVVSCGITKILQ